MGGSLFQGMKCDCHGEGGIKSRAMRCTPDNAEIDSSPTEGNSPLESPEIDQIRFMEHILQSQKSARNVLSKFRRYCPELHVAD